MYIKNENVYDLCLLIHFFNICHRPKTNHNCFIGTSGMYNTNDLSSLHECHFLKIFTYIYIHKRSLLLSMNPTSSKYSHIHEYIPICVYNYGATLDIHDPSIHVVFISPEIQLYFKGDHSLPMS
jgi:hypothetical protein